MGCLRKSRIGIKEMKLIKNLQKVSVSEGKTPAIALPETQLPPQIIIETTTERLKRAAFFELLDFTGSSVPCIS
jgi:hypothetical protein